MNTDETLFRLGLGDLHPTDVDEWWDSGYRTPGHVRDAIARGVHTGRLYHYVEGGVTGVDITRHWVAKIPADICQSLTLMGYTPVDQRRLVRRYGRDQIINMVATLERDRARFEGYLERHIDPALVDACRRAEVHPDQIPALADAQVPAWEVEVYADLGLRTAADITRRRHDGLTADEIIAFRRADVTDLDEMTRTLRAGVHGADLTGFARLGVTDLDTIAAARDHGLDGHLAARFADYHHLTDLDVIVSVLDAMPYTDVAAFWAAGLTGPDQWFAAHRSGLTARKADNYLRHGFTGPAVTALHAAGVTAASATRLREREPAVTVDEIIRRRRTRRRDKPPTHAST